MCDESINDNAEDVEYSLPLSWYWHQSKPLKNALNLFDLTDAANGMLPQQGAFFKMNRTIQIERNDSTNKKKTINISVAVKCSRLILPRIYEISRAVKNFARYAIRMKII